MPQSGLKTEDLLVRKPQSGLKSAFCHRKRKLRPRRPQRPRGALEQLRRLPRKQRCGPARLRSPARAVWGSQLFCCIAARGRLLSGRRRAWALWTAGAEFPCRGRSCSARHAPAGADGIPRCAARAQRRPLPLRHASSSRARGWRAIFFELACGMRAALSILRCQGPVSTVPRARTRSAAAGLLLDNSKAVNMRGLGVLSCPFCRGAPSPMWRADT